MEACVSKGLLPEAIERILSGGKQMDLGYTHTSENAVGLCRDLEPAVFQKLE